MEETEKDYEYDAYDDTSNITDALGPDEVVWFVLKKIYAKVLCHILRISLASITLFCRQLLHWLILFLSTVFWLVFSIS